MADTAQERTEKPTPRKRKEAREKGNVAKSTELNSVAVLITGIVTLKICITSFGGSFNEFIVMIYHESSLMELTPQTMPLLGLTVIKIFAMITLPVLLSIMLAGFVINFVQVGPLFANKALQPDFKKINPFSGIKRMVSPRSLVELIKGLLKIGIMAFVAYLVINKHIDEIYEVVYLSAGEVIVRLGSLLLEMSVKATVVLFIMAVADFAYQRYEYEKGLKMSRQEVKEESKQYEGNPLIKSAIRSKQMQMARKRMMNDVPEATVVVTNPTHIAIALKYEPQSKSDAPKVVAKGKMKLAERIKKIAREHGIPVIENKPLARGLYEACEVGMEIPVAFYQAVAEILTQVYQTDKKRLPNIGEING
ncbi:MAG: flagellar biosynthesis protein FlhB [Calditrichaeota bacterium]|nr:flagellar biosynthesis protein FlhB [Calditrichota bacterium]